MKLFAVTDIHGHATKLKNALQEAGFDPQNPDHLLISCGDSFDRGRENRAVLDYLQSIPNKVLVRGNHEDLLQNALWRRMISSLEVRNGTVITIEEFFGAHCVDSAGRIQMDAETRGVLEAFIGQSVDYFETERYVFTHGWVPLDTEWGELKPRRDWRIASLEAWRRARFMGWNKVYEQKVTMPDKTLVCGHRSTRYGSLFDPDRPTDCYDPFYGKNLIALDGLTVASGQVNVVVLEDELLPTHTHEMQLKREYFESVAEGSKTVEMRLLDEKRKKIRSGDTILFTCSDAPDRQVRTKVEGIYSYPGFEELVEDFAAVELGFDGVDKGKIVEKLLLLYGVEKAAKHKAVAIKLKRIVE